jgi:two-component system phosphate regulon sensor histidine kinase PhoR
MFFKKPAFIKIDNNSGFTGRVLILSLPAALVFVLLVTLDLLSPVWAFISYTMIIVFNMIFLMPISVELQQLKKYINRLAYGETDAEENINLSEQEAREIADAVNSMHKFWIDKADALEAQAMSDTAVLDTLPDPILMIDRAGNILGANLSTRRLLGNSVTEKNIENIFASNNFINAVSRVLKQESESENLIFYVQEPLNKKLYAHISNLPWFSKGRAVAVISLYDLTKAIKIEKMQSDFVANASHELRTPLSIVSGFIETLQTTAKNDEQAREMFLKIMADQTEYMSALIENLLSLSKIEMTTDTLPDTLIKIRPIIEDAVVSFSAKAKERRLNIVVDLDTDLPKITADATQISQLVRNLVDNAVKYAVSPSDIVISAKKIGQLPPSKTFHVATGEGIAVSINNQGPKISPENLTRLTERFYRMQEHKDLNIKGTGLGLSLAKQIIMRHRGNLTVSSTNYKGTTFTFYLPCRQN